MDTFYSLLIFFVLHCIISDWFIHEYGEKTSGDNFYKFKISSFFSYQIQTLKPIKRLVSLNEDNLAKQPVFWIGIISPFIVASWVEYRIILLHPDLLSFENIKELFDKSAPALYTSALTPTLGILISNIHRSIQTKKQIERSEEQINITKSKNNFDSFNSHVKIICDELNGFKVTLLSCEYVIKNKMKLYRDIFDKSSGVHGVNNTISENFISNLDKLHSNLYQKSGEYLSSLYFNNDYRVLIYKENKELIDEYIYNIHDEIIYLFEHFSLFQENYKFLDFTIDNSEGYNQLNIMNNIWKVLNEINIFIERFLYSIGYDFSLENEFTKNFYSTYMLRKTLGQNSVEYKKNNKTEYIEE